MGQRDQTRREARHVDQATRKERPLVSQQGLGRKQTMDRTTSRQATKGPFLETILPRHVVDSL
jgi:hypothetical protein